MGVSRAHFVVKFGSASGVTEKIRIAALNHASQVLGAGNRSLPH